MNLQPRLDGALSHMPGGITEHRDLPYVAQGHERQRLGLYLPTMRQKAPLILWVHGGAWLQGSKLVMVPLDYLVEGYAVASVNYRLSRHATFPAQIEDCKAAVRWLRAHADDFHLDRGRFGAWWSSAGGHLVALLGTTGAVTGFDVGEHLNVSSGMQAVVDYVGPTDLHQIDDHRLPGRQVHNTAQSPESLLVGAVPSEPTTRSRPETGRRGGVPAHRPGRWARRIHRPDGARADEGVPGQDARGRAHLALNCAWE